MRAHQRQRQLSGQKFIECQSRPEWILRQDVGQLLRLMHPVQRFADRRKRTATQDFGADPLRQVRELLQGLRHGAADRADREAFGQRIDRVDLRQLGETGLIDHAVGMHDLQGAIEHLRCAGDETLFALWQQLLDVVGLRAEVGQHHIAGLVAGVDQMRRAGAAGRCGAVAVDGDFQRHHGSGDGFRDCRTCAPVDDVGRQVQ